MDRFELEKHWGGFLRPSLVTKQFPRTMFRSRAKIRSREIYIKQLHANFTSMDCFISLNPLDQLAKGVVDCLFMEVDGLTLEDGRVRGWVVQKALLEGGYNFRQFFSGRRGFHFYLPCPPVQLKYPSRAIARFLQRFPLEMMDSHVLGNMAQLVRPPLTKNQISGLFAMELPADVCLKDVATAGLIGMSINPLAICPPGRFVPNKDIADELFEFDKDVKAPTSFSRSRGGRGEAFPPCMITALETLRCTGELSHTQRLHLTAFLVQIGYTDSEVGDIFRLHARDFKERTTMNQIQKIRKGRMSCYGCGRMRRKGVCPVVSSDDCFFFPKITAGSNS